MNASNAISGATYSRLSILRIQLGTPLTRYLAHFLFLSMQHDPNMRANFSPFASSCKEVVSGVGINAIPELIFATFPILILGESVTFDFF